MQILSNFRQASWIGKLKSVNLERICCPVGFQEDFSAVFGMKKSRIGTENDKKR